ncbi:MAG: DUF4438 domain-containing protein [Planctomycetota bacterium]|nr:MAG: DUF4438 domain-containing protein [Planctomycetota bacterium]
MIKSNLEKLVDLAVSGTAGHPASCDSGEKTAFDGGPFVPVGFSGINFTVKVGDSAFDWAGAHEVAPGVAVKNGCSESNEALLALSCIGNEAVLVDAKMEGKDTKLKGTPGIVTGKLSSGRVVVYFPKRIVERISVGDPIQIRASGAGLQLLDYPDVRVTNLGPRLLKALNPSEKSGKVRIPVAKVIPGKLMGAGIGRTNTRTYEYDIQSTSPEAVKEYSLDQLSLGDLVAIADTDCTHGPRWQQGATTVAVVVHGSSRLSGHGPGVNILLTSPKATIEPIITRKANLAELMGLQ